MAVNPIDLTTLAAVKKWASITGTGDDSDIQDAITAFSMYVITRTGRGPMDGSVPTVSPFCAPQTFTETYDGNNSQRMFLRNSPIVSVASLLVNGVSIPAAQVVNGTTYGQAGFVIGGDRKSLYIQSGGGGGSSFTTTDFGAGFGLGQYFKRGIQNITVQYSAGYSQVPFDLEMTARKVVVLNYKRKSWVGQKSQAMAQGAGTISFGDWEMDKDCERVICSYERRAMV